MSVIDVATELRMLKDMNAEHWPPERVRFGLFTTEDFDLAPARVINEKLKDDKHGYGRILLLEEAPNRIATS